MEDDQEQNQETETSCRECNTILQKPIIPITLKFHDLVYKIKTKKVGSWKDASKSTEISILKGISGIVRPGEMLAMLGPSGSGKTTLLTALGGRISSTRGRLSGTVTYNEKSFTNAMKRHTGFVTQDDILYPHLTVMETLIYTALLRLPESLSKSEKTQQAEAMIMQLGLSRCKNSIIGGMFLRGVSGGERKRVSIGQELLINPSLLFLDEPTSGLDSTTAQRIISSLWDLASGGRTIVTTIHQPSSKLFYMFHKVLLLCEGNPLYFGKGSDALNYFSSIGFTPSVTMNPADYLLDLASGISTGDSDEDPAAVKQMLMCAYKTYFSTNVEFELIAGQDDDLHVLIDDKEFKGWSTTWFNQFSVLFRRGIRERRHEIFTYINIAQVLFIAIAVGLLWWQSSTDNLQDKVGLFFFITSFWGFYPMFQAIFTFPQERLMLSKERSSGMYRLSAYFMALELGNLPMELILPSVFFTITYWMAGLKPSPKPFISGLLTLLYSVLCSQGLGLGIGATVMSVKSATVLGSVMMLAFQMASGYLVQHVSCFVRWMRYISISNYTLKLLVMSQLKGGESYPCGQNGKYCLVDEFPGVKAVGLHGYGVAVMALGLMIVGYRVIAYLALIRIGATRK